MLIEIFGWVASILFLGSIIYLIKKIFYKKKKIKGELTMSNIDMNHGPFSGRFKFKKKRDLLILLSIFSFSEIDASEKEINERWCASMGGITEFRTKDGTYVDCLTEDYAMEVEFDYNWKEAIGQSLHYAETTGKKPAIVIIRRPNSKKDYFAQIQRLVVRFDVPIKIFSIQE
jgi:hypothetical protein